MNLTEEQIANYRRDHNFSREKFITEIRIMHQVSVDLKEKPRLRSKDITTLETFDDLTLVKSHKFYWDKL